MLSELFTINRRRYCCVIILLLISNMPLLLSRSQSQLKEEESKIIRNLAFRNKTFRKDKNKSFDISSQAFVKKMFYVQTTSEKNNLSKLNGGENKTKQKNNWMVIK